MCTYVAYNRFYKRRFLRCRSDTTCVSRWAAAGVPQVTPDTRRSVTTAVSDTVPRFTSRARVLPTYTHTLTLTENQGDELSKHFLHALLNTFRPHSHVHSVQVCFLCL